MIFYPLIGIPLWNCPLVPEVLPECSSDDVLLSHEWFWHRTKTSHALTGGCYQSSVYPFNNLNTSQDSKWYPSHSRYDYIESVFSRAQLIFDLLYAVCVWLWEHSSSPSSLSVHFFLHHALELGVSFPSPSFSGLQHPQGWDQMPSCLILVSPWAFWAGVLSQPSSREIRFLLPAYFFWSSFLPFHFLIEVPYHINRLTFICLISMQRSYCSL